ncbi:hypothetical protein [Vibrio sp. L3-7]|uniref:hypothetical protein n=1 Tax=Vibrio sp. L3-7 TaxID=2912253 RepID=UPI001191FE1F|nr:hypothetical protein [Vibrio sp. L3-7]MCF7505795.1 hypothetical protein [Vibrio sp. L3-7]TVU69875.1 hypothetical protein FQP87_20065 [Vibrio tasmaniensis]
MLLEEVVEIIELTDSDHLSQAMELFNEHGFVDAESLPFMNVVFETAPDQLATKLSQIGFKGLVKVEKSEDASGFIIVDAERIQPQSSTQLKDSVQQLDSIQLSKSA